MKVLQEITKWPDGTPNHIYWVTDGGKCVAYDRGRGKETFTIAKNFDRRGRKFITIDTVAEPLAKGDRIVYGSKGDKYIVSAEGTCTCSGFKFRGTCKHVQ